uniref:IS630 transposase-related protein n=1 Tax=Nitrosococcus watsonii TaxID=473531 RepID=UPI00030686D9|nr:IS630 transposase-related protein [Nitrosococcus watsonii]
MDNPQPKVHGFRRGKINKSALKKHVCVYPDMFLHERADIFSVDTSSMSRALKAMRIVKKRARV